MIFVSGLAELRFSSGEIEVDVVSFRSFENFDTKYLGCQTEVPFEVN